MKRLKKFFLILFLILVVGTSFSFLGAGLWLRWQGPEWIEAQVQKQFDAKIEIESISTNFLNKITAKKITLDSPVSLSVQTLQFSYHPWNLLFRRHGTRNIFSLEIDNWNAEFQTSGNVFKIPKLSGFNSPPVSIIFTNGKVEINHPKFHDTAYVNKAQIHSAPLGMLGNIEITSTKFGDIKTNFKTPIIGQAIEYEIKADSIIIEKLVEQLKIDIPYGSFNGIISMNIKGEGVLDEPHTFKDRWNLSVHSQKLLWQSDSDHPSVPILMSLIIDPNKVHVKNLSLDNRLYLQGKALAPFDDPQFDFDITAKNADVSWINPFVPLISKNKKLSGTFDFSGELNGTRSDPEWDGKIKVNPIWNSKALPILEGHSVKKRGEGWVLNFEMGKGSIQVFPISPKATKYKLILNNFDINAFGKLANWENVTGSLDAALTVSLKPSSKTDGRFSLRNFSWGRATGPVVIKGDLLSTPNTFSITTDNNVLEINSLKNSNGWLVKKAHFQTGLDSFIDLAGTFYSDDRIDLKIYGQNIPPDYWPPLVSQYPNIKGHLNFTGYLNGTMENPQGAFNISFADLVFHDEGEIWNGSTEIFISKQNLQFKSLDINPGIKGTALLIWTPSPQWNVDVIMDKADPRLIRDLLKNKTDVGGNLTGHASGQIENGKWIGQSELTWKNGWIKDNSFDELSFNSVSQTGKHRLDELVYIKGASALKGSLDLRPELKAWQFSFNLQSEQWGRDKFRFDGEINLNGFISNDLLNIDARFDSPVLFLNNQSIENLNGKFEKGDSLISISGTALPLTHFNIHTDTTTNNLRGSLKFENTPLDDLLPFVGLENQELGTLPSGVINSEIVLSGTLNSPEAKVHIQSDKLLLKNTAFSLEAHAEVDSSSVSIVSSKLLVGDKGVVYSTGGIVFQDPIDMFFYGAAQDLDLADLLNISNLPLNWQGKVNGKFNYSVEKGRKEGTLVLEGTHEGISPFKGEGKIIGSVSWVNNELNLSGLTFSAGEGFLRLNNGSRIIIDRGSGRLHLLATSRNLKTGILTYFGNVELTGDWSNSTSSQPNQKLQAVNMDVFANSLWINQFLLNGNVTHLTIHPQEIVFSPILSSEQSISGKLTFDRFPELYADKITFKENNQERVFLNGYLGKYHWDYQLRIKDIDAGIVRSILDTTIPMTGPLEADLKGTGNLSNPYLRGKVLWKKGRFYSVPLDSASADLEVSSTTISLNKLLVHRDNGYDLSGEIYIPIKRQDELNNKKLELSLQVKNGDANLIEDLWKDSRVSKGSFEGFINMGYINGNYRTNGQMTVTDLNLKSSSYIPSLKRGYLKLDLSNDKLTVVHSEGRLDQGKLFLEGYVGIDEGDILDYNLALKTVTEEGLSIRVPELSIPPGSILKRFSLFKSKLAGVSRGEPIINLELKGPADQPTLSGLVKLENTIFTFPPSEKTKATSSEPLINWGKNVIKDIFWDVVVSAGKGTWYENELVNVRVNGSLHFYGETDNLQINGKITSTQGSIVYSGNEFSLDEAELDFYTALPEKDRIENKETFIYLKARAEKDVYYTDGIGNGVQDTIIMEVDRSLLGEIQPRFRSKNFPGMSSEKAVKLALGFDTSDTSAGSPLVTETNQRQQETNFNNALRVGLIQLLDTNLTSPLARALARQTGLVDFIRVTYQQDDSITEGLSTASSADRNEPSDVSRNEWWRYMKGTKVKMGREMSSRLFADYSFKVDEFENDVDLRHEVELGYRLHRNLFLRATTELDSERTLGRPPDRRAIIENRWRFGLPKFKKSKESDDESHIIMPDKTREKG